MTGWTHPVVDEVGTIRSLLRELGVRDNPVAQPQPGSDDEPATTTPNAELANNLQPDEAPVDSVPETEGSSAGDNDASKKNEEQGEPATGASATIAEPATTTAESTKSEPVSPEAKVDDALDAFTKSTEITMDIKEPIVTDSGTNAPPTEQTRTTD